MRYIITADDFGLSKSTNDAIYEGIEKGVITSTNIMVNMPYFKDAVKLKKNFSEISIGLHWNLTTGSPLSDRKEIPTLVDENGQFFNYTIFKQKLRKNEVSYAEIEKELRAQIKKFIDVLWVPDYWNTHNHFQMFPILFKLCIKVAKENGVTIMRNNYKVYIKRTPFWAFGKNIIIKFLYLYAALNKMVFTDGVLCFSIAEQKFENETYENKKNRTVEVILHIAKKIDSPDFGKLQQQRIDEYEFFMKEFIKLNKKLELISFKEYKKRSSCCKG